nr:unnamed protein product [Digitaria exilis]
MWRSSTTQAAAAGLAESTTRLGIVDVEDGRLGVDLGAALVVVVRERGGAGGDAVERGGAGGEWVVDGVERQGGCLGEGTRRWRKVV